MVFRRRGAPWARLVHLLPILVCTILYGGSMLYAMQFQQETHVVEGGQTLFGAILLSLPIVVVYCKWKRLPTMRVIDSLAVGTPLGITFGRVGCFCRGCCEGIPTSGDWGVCYPIHSNLAGQVVGPPAVLSQMQNGTLVATTGHSFPVMPVQLYEAGACIVIFGVLLATRQVLLKREGLTIAAFLALYSSWRFLIEFYRVEPIVLVGLTLSQVLSIGILLGTATLVALRYASVRAQRRALYQ